MHQNPLVESDGAEDDIDREVDQVQSESTEHQVAKENDGLRRISSNNDVLTGLLGDERERRRHLAEKYRQLYLLPRYVEEDDGSKRKLEPGEFHPDSKLYSLFTPIHDLSDFGVGVGMYFSTTFWFGILMLVCALIQTPVAHHFGTTKYDKYNYQDDGFKTFGSAACLDMSRVCLNEDCTKYAGEGHFPSQDTPRYTPKYDHFTLTRPGGEEGLKWYPRKNGVPFVADDDRVTDYDDDRVVTAGELGTEIGSVTLSQGGSKVDLWVGKRNCRLRRWFGAVDLAMMCVVCVSLLILGYKQNEEAEALDLAEQTAQDYSVEVKDPNYDEVDPDAWKEFFESKFGPVFSVTVCLDNGPLLKLLKKKRAVERLMRAEAKEEGKYLDAKRRASDPTAKDFLKELTEHQDGKSFFKKFMDMSGIDPSLEYYTLQLLKVNMSILELKKVNYGAAKVFVVFNNEKDQRACLEAMSVGTVPALLDVSRDDEHKFKDNVLNIREAPEPASIIYENLHTGIKDHVIQQCVGWSIMGVALVCTFFSVQACFQAGQPAIGAILISFWNSVLPSISRYLVVNYETHHTTEAIENSFLAKTVAARWFTSSIILYVVGISHPTQVLSPYFIGSIQAVLLADALTTPVFRMLDISGNLKRWVLAPMAGTDERAKALNVGTDWLLAERYTDLAKTVLMSLFFSAIFPAGYWYSALACFLCFWVDKFCLLRIFRQKPPAGDRLVRVTRTFTGVVVLIHAIITTHLYYSWPFDNLCRKSGMSLSAAGETVAAQLGVEDYVVYEYCNAISSHLLPPVGSEGWFQDGRESAKSQENLVAFMNVVAIIFIVYVALVYFGADATTSVYALFFYRYRGVGEAKEISFDSIENAQGYVPQLHVPGEDKSLLAVTAPHEEAKPHHEGGFEFCTYLLEWVAARERTGEESESELNEDLTTAEQDAIYRAANVFFDDQLAGLENKAGIMSRTKQYIKNLETNKKGDFARSLLGRKERSMRKKQKKRDIGSLAKRSLRRVSKRASSFLAKGQEAEGGTELRSMDMNKAEDMNEAHFRRASHEATAMGGDAEAAAAGDDGNEELEEMVRRSTLAEEAPVGELTADNMVANALAEEPTD